MTACSDASSIFSGMGILPMSRRAILNLSSRAGCPCDLLPLPAHYKHTSLDMVS
jgi:hypothetical protein